MANKETFIGEAPIESTPRTPFKFKLKAGSVGAENLKDKSVTANKIADNAVGNRQLAANSVESSNIVGGAVTTDKLADNSITTAKIQNNAVTENKIDDEAVTTQKIASNAVTGSKIDKNAVTEDKIADNAITNNKIVDGTITGDKFRDDSIDGSKIKNNSVSGSKLADGAIGAVDIQDNTLSGSKLVDNSVDGAKLVGGAVTTAKLKDNSIDGSKIADGTIQGLDIKDGTIPGTKLKDNSISGQKLKDGIIDNTKLADNSIPGSKLLDESINGEKIQPNTIHGSKLENNTVDGADIINGTLDGSKLKDNSIEDSKIVANAIETRHIKSNTISGTKIANDAIDSTKIRNNSLVGDNFANGAVTEGKLQNDTIATRHIADNAVTTGKIADNAVTTDKIPNGAVTVDKLAPQAVQQITDLEAQFQGNETTRQTNETTRISNETGRVNAESGRVEAETSRVSAETSRDSAETTRQSNETTRQSNETTRENNETTRVTNEEQRQTNETNRTATASTDHNTAVEDHNQAATDHNTAVSDHSIAEEDHIQAVTDHNTAATDHTTATTDHSTAADDHATAASDHTTATTDHTRAESDHTNITNAIASADLVFDISLAHASEGVLAQYADLAAALGTDGANVPSENRHGGMTVKFVQSSDNNYVQYRYMPNDATVVADFINVANWQGVDDEPVADSKNLITSGAVYDLQEQVEDNTEELEKKANKDGYYETLGAGTASNLRGQNTIEQQISYRPSGGNLDVATGAAFIDSIKGKTVKFNQKVVNGDFSNGTNGWSNTYNTTLSVNSAGVIVLNAKPYSNGGNTCCPQENFATILSHKYYLKIVAMWNYRDRYIPMVGVAGGPFLNGGVYIELQRTILKKMTQYSGIVTVTNNSNNGISFRMDTSFPIYYKSALRSFVCVDLTEMFGAGNEPVSAAAFEQWCEDNLGDSEYFDYDDGSLLSVNLESLKTTGFNLYNPNSSVIRRIKNQQYQITGTYTDVWESWKTEVTFNSYNYGDAVNYCEYFLVNGKRYLSTEVVPAYDVVKAPLGVFCVYNNQVYKCTTAITTAEEWNADHWTLVPDFAAMVTEGIFTMVSITPDANGIFTPTERYIHVEGGNATDTCVHLVHSGIRNGEYEPYKENTKSLPITTMQGRLNGTGELVTIFPDGLKSAGTVYDEIKVENGVVKAIKRVGSVDMGTLPWGYRNDNNRSIFDASIPGMFTTRDSNLVFTGACYPYTSVSIGKTWVNGDICWKSTDLDMVSIVDNNYTGSTAFKTAMSGVILYYELDTPQEYVVDGFDMPAQYLVDDWGTEMTIPQNDGEAVTALATLGIRYGVDAVDQLRRMPQTTITSESMDNFLIALGAQMGGTWTKTWNSETNKYDFTFTANPEPEEEVEP